MREQRQRVLYTCPLSLASVFPPTISTQINQARVLQPITKSNLQNPPPSVPLVAKLNPAVHNQKSTRQPSFLATAFLANTARCLLPDLILLWSRDEYQCDCPDR